MADRLLFDCCPGYLRVTFGPSHDDWIPMLLTLHGDAIVTTPFDDDFQKGNPEIVIKDDVRIAMRIVSLWCALGDLIRWLEAIVVGVRECAFEWDAEGPDGELRWHQRYQGKDGFFTAKWYGKETAEHRILLGTAQMVGAFYRGFRAFVASGNYDPLRYETLTVAEVAELVLEPDAMDGLAAAVANCGGTEASCLLDVVLNVAYFHHVGEQRMGGPKHPRPVSLAYCLALATQARGEVSSEGNPAEGPWLPSEWDAWSFDKRKSHMLDVVFPSDCWFTCGGGANLRQLRSNIIENWLVKHDTTAGKTREYTE